MKHIKGLDTLRAFAVICVIINHWGPRQFNSSPAATFVLQKVIPNGSFGVDLFFVLSGFLITTILLEAKKKAQSNEAKLALIKNFFVRRSLRIFPIYYLLLVLLLILQHETVQKYWEYFFSYTSNFLAFHLSTWNAFPHTWSLAVEEQFYLVWPFLIIYLPKRYLPHCMIVFIMVQIISSILLERFYGPFFLVLPLTCFGAFAIGGLYAYTNQQSSKWFKLLVLICLPLCLFLYFYLGPKFVLSRVLNSIISIGLIISIVEVKYPSAFKKLVENNLLAGIGKMSYGIYLYHYSLPYYYEAVVGYISEKLNFSNSLAKFLLIPPSGYVIQLGVLLAISYFSYKFIEVKFLRLKSRFNYAQENN